MEPDYLEGDIVICREIQRHLWSSKLHFKDWDFVIAHSTNNVVEVRQKGRNKRWNRAKDFM